MRIVIDLRSFTCGNTALGHPSDARDFFAQPLKSSDAYNAARDGFEVGTTHGILDYIFITMDAYQGSFARSGTRIQLDSSTTPERIRAGFGEPYWIDTKDDELILFYEFDGEKSNYSSNLPIRKGSGLSPSLKMEFCPTPSSVFVMVLPKNGLLKTMSRSA